MQSHLLVTQMRSFFSLVFLVACFLKASGSEPTYIRNGYLPLDALAVKQVECAKHDLDVPAAMSPIRLYKMRYGTVDLRGNPTTVSGLLILPNAAPNGVVLYYHSTIFDRELAPSRYTGTNKLLEPEYVMMAFATGGYAVFMPDTLGLGDNPGIHPYPFSEDNCRSGIDMIAPGRMIAKRLGTSVGKQLFVTGYSEGGATAMCAVRRLELVPHLAPDMAAPMSGPYDLSGVTAKSLLKGGQSPEGFGTKLFLLSYAAYSSQSNLGSVSLKDYFAPSFASYIPYVFQMKLDAVGIAKRFVNKAVQLGDVTSIFKILTHKFRDTIAWTDGTDPIMAAMMKSDCYNWAPRTKMLLPYLKGDDVVSDQNTLEAVDSMRLKGVGPDRLQPFEISRGKLSHSTAAPIAYSAARRFFDGGFSGASAH